MSSFAPMQELLARYRALEFHHNPKLAAELAVIQNWQKKRMQHTHKALFAVPHHALMTQYFLTRLYAGPDFEILAGQISRVVEKAQKFEKFVPSSTIKTGSDGIELAVLAIELDMELAQHMLAHREFNADEPDDAAIIQLYLETNQAEARNHQMDLLDQLGENLDKYVRSFVVQSAFKMARGAAEKRDFMPMYEFIAEGFAAMKPLSSAKEFISVFTQKEREIITRVHAGDPDPFDRAVSVESIAV